MISSLGVIWNEEVKVIIVQYARDSVPNYIMGLCTLDTKKAIFMKFFDRHILQILI